MRAIMKHYNIAVIHGDGIGPEITDATLAVIGAVAARVGFGIDVKRVAGGARVYEEHGVPMLPEAVQAVRQADATLKGPVGLPEVRMPDGTEAGMLGGVLRNGLDLYANVRPIRLYVGVKSALRDVTRGIDYVIVRENTEGLYASRGKGVGNQWAVADTLIMTRPACERIIKYAFELAKQRDGAVADGVRRVTLVDKANVLRSMFFFRTIFFEIAQQYLEIHAECLHVDAAAQALVIEPEHFDVLVTENLFGDILSDLGGATVGGIAMCPAGNIGDDAAYFEPIHGSAPSIAGKQVANPIGQILAAAMMFDHLGEGMGAELIREGVASALDSGRVTVEADGRVAGGPLAVAEAVIGSVEALQPE
jgi:isocitrate/isopropylmalate dehydrogenase